MVMLHGIELRDDLKKGIEAAMPPMSSSSTSAGSTDETMNPSMVTIAAPTVSAETRRSARSASLRRSVRVGRAESFPMRVRFMVSFEVNIFLLLSPFEELDIRFIGSISWVHLPCLLPFGEGSSQAALTKERETSFDVSRGLVLRCWHEGLGS